MPDINIRMWVDKAELNEESLCREYVANRHSFARPAGCNGGHA